MLAPLKNLLNLRRNSMNTELLTDDIDGTTNGPETDYDRESIWTVEKGDIVNERYKNENTNGAKSGIAESTNWTKELEQRFLLNMEENNGEPYNKLSARQIRRSSRDRVQKASSSAEDARDSERFNDNFNILKRDSADSQGIRRGSSIENYSNLRNPRLSRDSSRKDTLSRSTSGGGDSENVDGFYSNNYQEQVNFPKEKSRNIKIDENWMIQTQQKEENQEYLKITIEDLQKLINDNMSSAVSNMPKESTIEMTRIDGHTNQRLSIDDQTEQNLTPLERMRQRRRSSINAFTEQRNPMARIEQRLSVERQTDRRPSMDRPIDHQLSPPDIEHTQSDSETGLSFSSGNSMDVLLPNNKQRHQKNPSLHLVNPTRIGILKRFLPYDIEDSDSMTSAPTSETFLSSELNGRRRSLQPDMLRQSAERQRKDLYLQSNVLRGNTFNQRLYDKRRQMENMDQDFDYHRQKTNSRRNQRFGRSIAFDVDDSDSESMSEGEMNRYDRCRNSYTCQCSDARYPKRQRSCHPSNKAYKQNYNTGVSSHYPDPEPPQQVPVPQVMLTPPSLPPSPRVGNMQADIQKVILQQIQEVLRNTQKSHEDDKESEEQVSDHEVGKYKKEDNPFARIQAKLEENKKKKKENKPIFIAKIVSVVFGGLFLLCAGGMAALGVYNMVSESNSVYTDVSRTSKSDMGFQLFCYALVFVGACAVFTWLCVCCGSIRLSTCCLKTSIIAVLMLLVIQSAALCALYLMRNDVISVPLLSVFISQVRQSLLDHLRTLVIHQYKDNTAIMSAWDRLQVMAQCCGFDGPSDFEGSIWRNETKKTDPKQKIPNSCCQLKEPNPDAPEPTNKLLCQTLTPGFSHQKGCYEVLGEWYNSTSIMALSVLAALTVSEIIVLICVFRMCKLANRKRKKKRDNSATRTTAKKSTQQRDKSGSNVT